MFPRRMPLPGRSFFLFGPRGAGKTTWLRQVLSGARWYDLLLGDVYVRLLADPAAFRRQVEALPAGTWVVVDEVQRIPALLNEVEDSRYKRLVGRLQRLAWVAGAASSPCGGGPVGGGGAWS